MKKGRANKSLGKLWNAHKHLIGARSLVPGDDMIEYERGIVKRLSTSQARMGRIIYLLYNLCGFFVLL
uniref:Uncharacterized protein n=1 Tax=Mola mola TaxID=94237 RepID=A0A3Q3X6V5_MOLML